MQQPRDSYLVGSRVTPLMDGAEEIRRSTGIHRLRRELWEGILRSGAGPRVVLHELREFMPETAGRLSGRLLRLARSSQPTARSLGPLSIALDGHDQNGELASRVLASLDDTEDDDPRQLKRLRSLQQTYRREKHHFVLANLGLVFKVANRYRKRGLPLHDLVQDGCMGLMKAVDMFDPEKGFRFSTYAVWWIRHAIGRALADRSRTIRVPVHLISLQAKLKSEKERLGRELRREPTAGELARACGVSTERVGLAEHAFSTSVVSLDQPRGAASDGDSHDIPGDDPTDALHFHLAADGLDGILAHLDSMEADVVRKRFGLERTDPMTLQQIGDEYALSRERIRQMKIAALRKMRAAIV